MLAAFPGKAVQCRQYRIPCRNLLLTADAIGNRTNHPNPSRAVQSFKQRSQPASRDNTIVVQQHDLLSLSHLQALIDGRAQIPDSPC